NWYNSKAADTWHRSIIVWNYVDPGGKLWPVNTYSRNWYSDIYAGGGISGNVITLRVPWAGPAIPAGTSLSNGYSGGAYMYLVGNTVANAPWSHYSGRTTKGGWPGGTTAATTQFPLGTAKAKVCFLTNYPTNTNSIQSFGNVSFTEVTAGADAQASADAA